eukprot:261734_1
MSQSATPPTNDSDEEHAHGEQNVTHFIHVQTKTACTSANEDHVDDFHNSDDDTKVPTTTTSPISVDTKQNLETFGKCDVIKKRFNQIFDASAVHYHTESTIHQAHLPNAFRVFRNMCFFYLLCVCDCVTDILVLFSLSKSCKRATFHEANQLHTYSVLLTLSYVSAMIGILNVARKYYAAIRAYTSNENDAKSMWNDGFKYATIKYIQETDVSNRCTTEKTLKTFFVIFEDWIQFGVTYTLLLFFQDANMLHLLSWATSLLIIACHVGTDMFSCIRCLLVTCCKCCHLKDKCYDRKSACMNIYYWVSLCLFGFPILFCVPLFLFAFQSPTSSIIGGTIYYQFEGNVHWIGADNPVIYNLTGTFRTNPLGDEYQFYISGCEYCDDAIGLRFERLKVLGPYKGHVRFNAYGSNWETYMESIFLFTHKSCTDLDTVVNCSMSSKDLDPWHGHSDGPGIYYNDSVWGLRYQFVFYDSCHIDRDE